MRRAIFILAGLPLLSFVLGFSLDLLCRGKPARLNGVALVLAVAASVLLLLLPLRSQVQFEQGQIVTSPARSILAQDGLRGIVIWSMAVVVAALPLLVALPARNVEAAPARVLLIALRISAAVCVAGWMYYNAPTLLGFLYLPSVVALGIAAIRSLAPARPGPKLAQVLAISLWNTAAIFLLIPPFVVVAFAPR